jgi:hypothetical protein
MKVWQRDDDNLETLNIQIELPSVDKKDIDLRFFDEGFYLVAKKEAQSTWAPMLWCVRFNRIRPLQNMQTASQR